MIRSTLLTFLLIPFLTFTDDPPPESEGHGSDPGVAQSCKGSALRWENEAGWRLYCTPGSCVDWCGQVAITTPLGEGTVCDCNVSGPEPDCCRLVVLCNGRATTTGACDAPGCGTNDTCLTGWRSHPASPPVNMEWESLAPYCR